MIPCKWRWASCVQELAPRIALQKVAAPLEDAAVRAEGIALLRRVLWKDGAPVAVFPTLKKDRVELLQTTCGLLTASEQVRPLHKPGIEHRSSASIVAQPARYGVFTNTHRQCVLH